MTNLDALMARVDATTSAEELANLQLEFQQHCQRLTAGERRTLIQSYTDRIKQRGQSISEQLTALENDKISA